MFLLPSAVYAGSSSVDQSRIVASGMQGEAVASRLRVTNTDTIDQQYQLSTPETFSEPMSMNPQKFRLKPGQSQDVVVRFWMPEESQKIYVTLLASDSRQRCVLKVASAINIPIEFVSSRVAGVAIQNKVLSAPFTLPNPWHLAVYLIDAMLIIATAIMIRRHRPAFGGHGNY